MLAPAVVAPEEFDASRHRNFNHLQTAELPAHSSDEESTYEACLSKLRERRYENIMARQGCKPRERDEACPAIAVAPRWLSVCDSSSSRIRGESIAGRISFRDAVPAKVAA